MPNYNYQQINYGGHLWTVKMSKTSCNLTIRVKNIRKDNYKFHLSAYSRILNDSIIYKDYLESNTYSYVIYQPIAYVD